jgi:N-acetylglucosamine-6-phosphate deacetylase
MAERILVRGGTVVLPGGMAAVDILAEGGRIAAVGASLTPDGAPVVDATGLTVGPGFIDVHVHGGGGHNFFRADSSEVEAYSAWAPRNGVTAFLVSTVGRNADETDRIFAALASAIGRPEGAEALGFHLEGPFINPKRMGAFQLSMLRLPDAAEFRRHQEAARGAIRQVTLAPELPGALELAEVVARSGAVPAMGHTDATVAEARAGFARGVGHVTHLFNAMRPIHQREGGPGVAALLEDRVSCELICDGAHVSTDVLRMAYRLLGPSRTVVVTDNLHLAGTERSAGQFGGQSIAVEGAKAVRADGTIVGSIATMDAHFRNAVAFLGIDVATAFRLCSANPARIAGAERRKGSIEVGKDADLVLLGPALQVRTTICRGEVAYERPVA